MTKVKATTIKNAKEAKRVAANAAKKAAIGKAKASQQVQVAKELEASNVITLEKPADSIKDYAGAAIMVTTAKDIVIDATIPHSMQLAAAPEGTRLKSRFHEVGAENIEEATRLFNSDDIAADIKSFGRDAVSLQWRSLYLCVAIAGRLQRDKGVAMPLLHSFMNAVSGLGNGLTLIRTNNIRSWFEKYACVTWDKPIGENTKTFIFDKNKHHKAASEFTNKAKYFKTRLAKPFWLFEPEGEYAKFDWGNELSRLIEKAMKASKLTAEQREAKYGKDGLKLGNFETIRNTLLTLSKLDSKEDEEPKEEPKEEEAEKKEKAA